MSWPVPETMMIEPTESESLAELDRFCEAMIAIREEIRAIERGSGDRQDNPLKRAPHTADLLLADWTRPYPKRAGLLPDRRHPRGQVLAAGGAGRQRLWRPAPGLQMPAAGGVPAGGGIARRGSHGPRGLPAEYALHKTPTAGASLT